MFSRLSKWKNGNVLPNHFQNLSLYLAYQMPGNAWMHLSSYRFFWKLAKQLLSEMVQLLVESKRVYILKTTSIQTLYAYLGIEVEIFECFPYFDSFMLGDCRISNFKNK